MMTNKIINMILYGIITVIVGYIVGYLLEHVKKTKIPENCKDWNKNHIMEISLFITGAITWYIYSVMKILI